MGPATKSKTVEAVLWLLRKSVEQALPVILPTVLLWGIGALGAARVWAHQKSVPLWVFIVVLVPASFGVVTLVTRVRMRRRLAFHVTADPVRSYCCDAKWGDTPAAQVLLQATIANSSKYDLLLLYAYLKGTKPLMHFEQPVQVPPHKAIQERVMFFCTRPKGTIAPSYEPTVIFVDAGGRKHRQRVTMMGLPGPAPASAPATKEIASQRSS